MTPTVSGRPHLRVFSDRKTGDRAAAAGVVAELRRRLATQPGARMVVAAAPSHQEMPAPHRAVTLTVPRLLPAEAAPSSAAVEVPAGLGGEDATRGAAPAGVGAPPAAATAPGARLGGRVPSR